jgi:hypothetical protein
MDNMNSLAEFNGIENYFAIIIIPKNQFCSFCMQHVGRSGGLQRIAGKLNDGSWRTHAWLISKNDAHIEGGKIVPDSKEAKNLLSRINILSRS